MAATFANSAAWSWLVQLGGLGLILFALLDNSVFPTPGGMDILVVVLAASHGDWWWYYALMATLGSLLGAWPTYRLGRKGGEEALEKKFPRHKVERVYRTFNRYGPLAIIVPALIPPPFPLPPFLAAAGALKVSPQRFFASLAAGRLLRYGLLAWLGSRYSRQILGFFSAYYKPILWGGVALGVLAGVAAVLLWRKHRHGARQRPRRAA